MANQIDGSATTLTRNKALLDWVRDCAGLLQPDRVVWCDGSEAERERLTKHAVDTGVLIPLNPEKRPGCYLHRSNPNDVARVEHLTFICTPTKDAAGPDQQLDGARRGLRQADQALRRLDEGPHHVRRPVRHGAGRLAAVQGRHRAHRQRLRGPQHADHDPHGEGRAGHARRLQRLQPRPALHRRRQPRAPLHLPLPRRTTPSGASARATAATRSSARSASRSASAATSARTRAGSPSTCSSSASRAPTGR